MYPKYMPIFLCFSISLHISYSIKLFRHFFDVANLNKYGYLKRVF